MKLYDDDDTKDVGTLEKSRDKLESVVRLEVIMRYLLLLLLLISLFG